MRDIYQLHVLKLDQMHFNMMGLPIIMLVPTFWQGWHTTAWHSGCLQELAQALVPGKFPWVPFLPQYWVWARRLYAKHLPKPLYNHVGHLVVDGMPNPREGHKARQW